MTTQNDYAATARGAIEIVCSGDLSRMEDFYNPDFMDRINDTTFYGYRGGQESVAFYRAIFEQLRMAAEEQITEGNRVASRCFARRYYRLLSDRSRHRIEPQVYPGVP